MASRNMCFKRLDALSLLFLGDCRTRYADMVIDNLRVNLQDVRPDTRSSDA